MTAGSGFHTWRGAVAATGPGRADAAILAGICGALDRMLASDIASEAAFERGDEAAADEHIIDLDEAVDELLVLLAEAQVTDLLPRLRSHLTEHP